MIAKKSLVAVAALLAAAGAAQAQSSVKLYGLVDMGVASLELAHDKGASTRTTAVESGMMTTSFIGFAGVEDLGGGLKAEFTLESFIGADTGANVKNMAGQFWSRASNVALSGGFGKVALGQYDNPLFTSGYTYNPFGSSMVVSPTMRHFYSGGDAASLGFDTGWVNSVTYESPNLQGFNFVAQAALKEAAGSSNKNSYALAGSYNAGPLSAMLTYVKSGYTSAQAGAYPKDQKVWNLGTSYDFGVAKAFLQYTDAKTTREATTTVDYKNRIYQVGASVPLNDKAAVMVSFGQNKYSEAGFSAKDEVFTVGYDYALSKRTDVYGAFMNNRQSDMESGQSVAVGIRHNF